MPDRHNALIGIHFTFQAFQRLQTLFVKALANTDGNKIRRKTKTKQTNKQNNKQTNKQNNKQQTNKSAPVASLPTLKVGKTIT